MLHVLPDWVIVEEIKVPEKTPSGIILPEKQASTSVLGTVVSSSIYDGVRLIEGWVVRVLTENAHVYTHEGKELMSVPITDVIMIIKQSEE